MTPLTLIGGSLAGIGLLVLAVRSKLRRDAIRQGGGAVGSALLGEAVAAGARQARFVIIRGEPAFREAEPFGHGGQVFQMIAADQVDARSAVLRRFIGVTCRVLGPDAP